MTRPFSPGKLDDLMAPLPADRPFTAAQADECGVGDGRRRLLLERGRMERRLPGVFHVAGLIDSLELRLQCLELVVPDDCVVTDRTAAWVWVGDRALAPDEHLSTPLVSVFAPPGRRLRNGLTTSGERMLLAKDVVEVGGLRLTTPLRTACDLGRLLHPDQAFAAMDSLATLRVFDVDELVEELGRFKGYRGIVQARTWAPFVDPDSDSQFETIGRRRWLTAGLPRPTCQCPVEAPYDGLYHVDFGLPDDRFGGEYFGEEFHGEDEEPHDDARLVWLRGPQRWFIVVARKHNVVGPHQDLEQTFRIEWERHRARSRLIA